MEFKVNAFISLKLEGNETIIYIKGKKFRHCKFLLLDVSFDEFKALDEIESIDAAAEKLDSSLEPLYGRHIAKIAPEVEFWGHCSNIQVWTENNYNTNLIHSNLAFPLLKELVKVGDPKAKEAFKKELIFHYM